MKTIYLIRHSEPFKKKQLHYFDPVDTQEQNERLPLSPVGEKKAHNLAEKVFADGIESVWCSPYLRAIATAKYIGENNGIPLQISACFGERITGRTEGIPEEFWLMQLQDANAKAPEGESRKDVTGRMLAGLYHALENASENSKTVIISHGTAITFLLMHWCELTDVQLDNKKRQLVFRGKEVINDSFGTPEVFRLVFDGKNPISIERTLW